LLRLLLLLLLLLLRWQDALNARPRIDSSRSSARCWKGRRRRDSGSLCVVEGCADGSSGARQRGSNRLLLLLRLLYCCVRRPRSLSSGRSLPTTRLHRTNSGHEVAASCADRQCAIRRCSALEGSGGRGSNGRTDAD